MIRKVLPIILVLIMPFKLLYSQDFHYSQFYNEPLNFNPSLAGVMDGDKRIIFSIRDQYRTAPVPYFTMSASYDMKFLPDVPKRGYFSAGAFFNYDKQGDAKFTLFNFNVAGSYTYYLNNKHLISGGALIGYSNRGFSKDDLRWDNHWDPTRETVDLNRAINEPFESFRFSYLETGLGVNYRYQHSHRNNVMLGLSAFHLNTPSQNFYNIGNDQLDMRLSGMIIANLKVAEKIDIQGNFLYQKQDVYEELIFGGIAKLYLNNKRGEKLAFHIGLMDRLNEGWAPKLAVEYNEWYVSMNYDIVSKTDLSDITNYRGGPEVHVRYTIKDVRPLGEFKICPIY